MPELLKYIPITISICVLFCVSIGIYRASDPLQKLHFSTIADVICIPLAVLSALLIFGISSSRLLYVISLVLLISPIPSYFLGKVYIMNKKHHSPFNDQPSKIIIK